MSFTYFFSYWVFVWYLLYILKVLHYSPKLALTIALLENLIKLGAMVYFQNKLSTIVFFCTMIFFLKVLPLWTLRRLTYKHQIHTTLGLFMVYLFYLYVNDQNVVTILKQSYQEVKNNKFGPMGNLIKKIEI